VSAPATGYRATLTPGVRDIAYPKCQALARTHFVFYIDAQDEQDLIDYCERSRALDDAGKLNVPPGRHHPVDPVYRCKFAPVVVKLGTREIPGSVDIARYSGFRRNPACRCRVKIRQTFPWQRFLGSRFRRNDGYFPECQHCLVARLGLCKVAFVIASEAGQSR